MLCVTRYEASLHSHVSNIDYHKIRAVNIADSVVPTACTSMVLITGQVQLTDLVVMREMEFRYVHGSQVMDGSINSLGTLCVTNFRFETSNVLRYTQSRIEHHVLSNAGNVSVHVSGLLMWCCYMKSVYIPIETHMKMLLAAL